MRQTLIRLQTNLRKFQKTIKKLRMTARRLMSKPLILLKIRKKMRASLLIMAKKNPLTILQKQAKMKLMTNSKMLSSITDLRSLKTILMHFKTSWTILQLKKKKRKKPKKTRNKTK